MRGKLLALKFLVVLSICFASGTNAAEMVPEYLHGNWLFGTAEQECGASGSEYFIFRENGTFEVGRSGKAEVVGFWEIDGDFLHLDFISSPGFYQDIHAELKDFADEFHYMKVKVIHFNVDEHRFEMVGVLGDQIKKGVAVRCK